MPDCRLKRSTRPLAEPMRAKFPQALISQAWSSSRGEVRRLEGLLLGLHIPFAITLHRLIGCLETGKKVLVKSVKND